MVDRHVGRTAKTHQILSIRQFVYVFYIGWRHSPSSALLWVQAAFGCCCPPEAANHELQ